MSGRKVGEANLERKTLRRPLFSLLSQLVGENLVGITATNLREEKREHCKMHTHKRTLISYYAQKEGKRKRTGTEDAAGKEDP
jgi:hypothetical protein